MRARGFRTRRGAFASAVMLSAWAYPALAQNAPAAAPAPAPASAADDSSAIIVTGYRASLESSAKAKRDSVGFTDSIFAEDIGKFPDTNIAESFNRIPGVTITREITGEGLNVSIRGLGTNFTRVLLNNAPIAIASTGRTDAQGSNREVDLDLFPTELFTQLTVSKSPTAEMLEGGAAGTVNMRSARPFDSPGAHLTYSGQAINNSVADKWGYRGSLLGSYTFGDFGILAGVAGVHNKVRTTGFETIGWTNPNLTTPNSLAGTTNGVQNTPTPAQILASQCRANNCNSSYGGNGFSIPGTVPANAGNGLTTGDAVNQDFLLAHNPGATIQQIDNGLIPRLGRPSDEYGTKDRINGIVSLEYKGDRLHAYIDGMYGWKKNDLTRIDMNWVGRNGSLIPLNTTYDKTDCSAGCTVTSGTYANAQFFLEYRPFIETTRFWGVNPGFDYEIADNLKFDLQANYTRSRFHRESPTVLVITPGSSGVTVDYTNDGGVPVIDSSVDLNDPTKFGWPGGRVNIQDERRKTETKGVRGDLTWGGSDLNLKVGGAYDDVMRRIQAYDASQAWQNAVCGDNPSVFLPGPNTQPGCQGLNQAGAAPAGYPTYPAFGTGYSSGMTGPVTYAGSLIPQTSLANYLMPGRDGFITLDWNRFRADSHYDSFHDAEGIATSANTNANSGYIREKTLGGYAEVNGDTALGDMRLNWNVGARYVHTEQTIGGFVSVPDTRNIGVDPDGPGPQVAPVCPNPVVGGVATRDGSCYPNTLNFVKIDSSYNDLLPSASAALHITDKAVARASVSETMTRADPSAELPGLNFGDPSAANASIGNPSLHPYKSFNIDIGFEYYTGQEGMIGFAAFRKALTGFTQNQITTVPFSFLAQYGITYDTITPTQQTAITSRGGPSAAQISLSQQVNSPGTLKINGLEFTWVQPLDFVFDRYLGIKGLGFNANVTLVDQKASGSATNSAVALGVAPVTYNATLYYENYGVTARLSTTFTRGSQTAGSNQNGISTAALFSDDYQQWDFSSSFALGDWFGNSALPELTFDVVNITKAKQRSYFQFENAAFTNYTPGRAIMVGLRGRF